MTRRRKHVDGLPFRVYERRGLRVYSVGYKLPDGKWAFRLQCPIDDKVRVAQVRHEAIDRSNKLAAGAPSADSFSALVDAWFSRQESFPIRSPQRRADSTLMENKREAVNLKKAFGHMRVDSLLKSDAYGYLDACVMAGRPAKGNKEISLARTILEFAVRVGTITSNPFDGVQKLVTLTEARYVTDVELDLALQVGRAIGGPQLICALALKTAWLCVRRSVEVRAFTRSQITPAGIEWRSGKVQKGHDDPTGLIEWSDELRQVIDEALAIERFKVAGTWYVFGNLSGQRYTKGGWKATLSKLMKACQVEADRRGIQFRPFSLQDCRPKGVSDKLAAGHRDTTDATLHSNDRMVRQVYDRRRVRVAKPTR